MHTKYLHYAWKMVLAFALAAVMALSVVTEVFVRTSAQSVIAEDGKYYTDYDSLEGAQEAAADLALDVASEGDTLLKNKDGALPLKGGEYVSVFGTAQDSLANYNGYPLLDALEDEGFRVNPKLRNYYESIGTTFGEEQSTFAKTIEGSYNLYNDVAIVVLSRGGGEGNDMATVTDEEATDDRNVNGWEHEDLYEEDGKTYKHFLQMTDSEEALFDYVKAQGFKKIVYLINSSEIFEMYNLENDDAVNAILWIGRPGQEGTKAAAKILSGAVNPSGKTVDTWYTDFTADPTWQNFGTNVQVGSTNNYSKADGTATAPEGGGGGFGGGEGYFGIDYEEDIYVGYRYYETAAKEGVIDYDKAVVYPFGYGLSYTTFSYGDMSVKMSDGSDMTGTPDADLFSSSVGSPAKVKTATATVTVTNDGKVAGKETVELYVTAPYTKGEVEKAHVTLVAFAKTDLLQPGQSQTPEIPFNVQDLASYDYTDANKNGNKGYEMDAGEYILRVMGNARGWAAADAGEASADYQEARFTLDADVIMKLDDFSDNEVTNLFSQENGIFYSLRDNTNAKYQFNKDASANETLMSRADLAGTFPVAPTAADMTLSEKMYESLQYWDNFSVDNDATYADGKVVEGIADADDYPWMAEVTENSERMKTWTQAGTFDVTVECKADVWISAQREYSIEVASAFTIDTTEGKLGEEFYAVIESDTVNNKNYTSVEYDIAEGSLPKGLTLAANGELEGTPTEAGSFPLTVRVTATTVTSGWRPVTTYTYFKYELTLEIAEGDVSDVPLVEIGENGNWFIEGVDTGVSATGPQGPQGPAGEDGQMPEITISEDGFWVIDGEKTTVSAQGPQGPAGPAGEDGKGCGGSIGAVSAIGAVVLLAAVGALLLARRKEN